MRVLKLVGSSVVVWIIVSVIQSGVAKKSRVESDLEASREILKLQKELEATLNYVALLNYINDLINELVPREVWIDHYLIFRMADIEMARYSDRPFIQLSHLADEIIGNVVD